MCYVHLHVFICYLVESRLWHCLDDSQILHQIFCTTKQRSILPNGLRTNLSGKVVETTKQIGVEVGGKNKKGRQIKDAEVGYLVKDDMEFAAGNSIPIWMFGFIY